jgi:hypothetical protein
LLGGFDQFKRPAQWTPGSVAFNAQAGFCFAENAIALRDLVKRCGQFDEQHDVLWLGFLWELDFLLDHGEESPAALCRKRQGRKQRYSPLNTEST